MDTVKSGIVDQNLRQLSELDLSSRDPIDGFNLDDNMGQRGGCRDLLYDYSIQNKSGRKLLSHLSELSSHLVLRSAAEAVA